MTTSSTSIKLNSKDIAEAICSDYEWYELRELDFNDVRAWVENNYGCDVSMTPDEVKNLVTDLRNNNWEMYWYET
jgi:hypothetical protein